MNLANSYQAPSQNFAMALSININQPESKHCHPKAGKHGKHGKAGKHGKHGKHGKAGKHGKHGKHGKAEKAQGCDYNSPLHSQDFSMAIAAAGNMGGLGFEQQDPLTSLLIGLLMDGQMNTASMGANPGMGGYLQQFGRGGF